MKPVQLNMKNFFSHKESTIDFNFDVALLVGNTEGNYDKSNGSGKSAVLEGICWALFNKCRAAKVDQLVKWGEDQAEVSLIFEEAGETYKVERFRNRISGVSSVNFYKLDDIEAWTDLSGSTNTLTNKEIETVLKCDYKTFVNSVYFRQNDISEFAEAEPFRKKEILKNMIEIDRWDEYERLAKDKCKQLKLELELLKTSLYDSDELEKNKEKISEELLFYKERLEKLKNSQESLESKYSHSYEKYVNMKNSLDTNQYDRVNLEIKSLNESLASLKKDKSSLSSDLSSLKSQCKSITSTIYKLEQDKKNLDYIDDIDGIMSVLTNKIIELKSDGKLKKSQYSSIKDKEIKEDNCSVCGQHISEELHFHLEKDREDKLTSLKEEMSDLKSSISKAELELKILESKKETNNLILSIDSKIEMSKEKLSFFENQISSKESNAGDIEKFIKTKECKIVALEQTLLSLKNDDFVQLKSNIKLLKEEKRNVSDSIFESNRGMAVLENDLKEIEEKIAKNKKLKLEMKDLNEKIVVLEHLYKYLGKSGIQVILINSLIEDLESHTNRILSEICNEPIEISLDTQKLRSDKVSQVETLDLNTIKDGFKYDFKSLSGGEKFRIALSTRTGLSEISSQYSGANLEFIMMDEINSPLDKHGTDNLVEIIKKLSDKYMILMITHDDRLKEKFDTVINVSKVNGESSVNFIDYN